jgi:UDP-N-acetylglucosamine acyltransferase
MSNIHSTAIVSSKAKIGNDVEIGPYAIIEDDVEIGDGSKIGHGAGIYNGARIGKRVKIFQNASISNFPQDLKFDGEITYLHLGDDCVVREFAALHRATHATEHTRIGNNCLLMAYTHVAHDCQLGNNIILSNGVQLAGHVHIEDSVIVGGLSAIHQFCSIGKHCMIGGGSMINTDVPPFLMTSGYPARYMGLNIVGLRRRGFTNAEIEAIKESYRIYYLTGLTPATAREKISEKYPDQAYVKEILTFMEKSTRGIIRK